MLQQILNVVKSIGDLVVGLVKFIPKLLTDFIMVIDLVVGAVAQLPTMFVVFPSVISALLISVFGVVVVYKILGREG